MKKMLPILIAFLLVFLPIASCEEAAIDFGEYSDDELIALQEDISRELEKRNASPGDMIHNGVYVAGQNIRAGEYDISFVDVETYVCIKLYDDEIEERCIFYELIEDGNVLHVSLQEGNVLEITHMNGAKCIIRENKPSWVP